MDHPFKYFTHIFEKGLVENHRKIILTVAVMNSDTVLKDEQGKEEENTVSPHCKLTAAWM